MSQPPYGLPNQFGMGNQPPPGPQKSNTGLIVGIVALVVVVAVVVAALVFTLTRDDGDDNTDDRSSNETSSQPTDPTSPSPESPSPESESSDPATDGSSIEGDGYTYSLPDGWTDQAGTLDEEEAPDTIDTVSAWGEQLEGGRANTIVETGPANGQTDLESLTPSWKQNLTSGDRKPKDINPITIDGYDAVGVRMDGTNSSGAKITQTVYLTVVEDMIYSIGLSTTPDDASEATTMFDEILNSWTWG